MPSKAYPKNISLVTNYSNYLTKQNNKDCHDNLIRYKGRRKCICYHALRSDQTYPLGINGELPEHV